MKWLRNILKASTLTTALFIFQACYGTPQRDFYEPGKARMSFSLVSKTTGLPLEGITISVGENELGVTNADGHCVVLIPYERNTIGPFVNFQDPEGKYMPLDTMLADLRERDILIELDSAE